MRYDDNRNGRITCKEARRHGIAAVCRSHPANRYMQARDGDSVAWENESRKRQNAVTALGVVVTLNEHPAAEARPPSHEQARRRRA